MNKFIFIGITSFFLVNCTVDGSLVLEDKSSKSLNPSIDSSKKSFHLSSEIVNAQIKKTSNGYQLNGQFDQVNDKKNLANGYSVEGVFNE